MSGDPKGSEQGTGFHVALCERDDCPWKFRGVTAEATDEAARQHCVVAGHTVVRRDGDERWRCLSALNESEKS